MADINVERRGPKVWPWIIGLVVLVLLIWAIAEMVDRDSPTPGETVEVVPEQVTPAAEQPATAPATNR